MNTVVSQPAMIEVALGHARRGWPVLPCKEDKSPRVSGGFKSATKDEVKISDWWNRWPDALVGMPTGPPSGVVVLDVDKHEGAADGWESLNRLESEHGPLPVGPTVHTRNRGAHHYFRIPDGVEIRNTQAGPGLDIRGDGGYVIAPGSPGWEWDAGTEDLPLPDMPGWLLDLLTAKPAAAKSEPEKPEPENGTASHLGGGGRRQKAYARAALLGCVAEVSGAGEGKRNDKLNRCAFHIGRMVGAGWLDQHEAETGLLNAALLAGLNEGGAGATIKSGLDDGIKKPHPGLKDRPKGGNAASTEEPVPWMDVYTHLEGAKRVQAKEGRDHLHKTGMGSLHFDGVRWRQSNKPIARAVQGVAHDVRLEMEETLEQAKACADKEEAEKLTAKAAALKAFVRMLESNAGCAGVKAQATVLPGIDADDLEFDEHPHLLTCTNGTIDLRTGELLPHNPEHYITTLVPHPYDPAATCPRWERFLGEVFDGDQEIIDYVQWACGYTITGCTDHHLFFVCHGSGRNGKSKLLGALQHVMGKDLAHQGNVDAFMMQKHAQHTCELAVLRGKRMLSLIETGSGKRLNEPLVKSITGQDDISGRLMRENPTTFRPVCKLWMATNHLPRVQDESDAMWSRIRLLPFAVSFLGREQKDLEEELKGEAAGILAWCVRGAKRAFIEEPPVPAAVQAATQEYREQSDTLTEFLDSYCELLAHAKVGKTALYKAYSRFCGGHCENIRPFNDRIKGRGFEDSRLKNGPAAWRGIGLLHPDNDNDSNDLPGMGEAR